MPPKQRHSSPGGEGRHRAPDAPGDSITSRGEPRRAAKPGEKVPRYKPGRARPIVEIVAPPKGGWPAERTREMPKVERPHKPATPAPVHRGGDVSRRERAARLVDRGAPHAASYAQRATVRATSGGKPSVTGRAASGAAAGAASGAAVGGPAGAAVGGVVGGAAGAVSGHRAKREYKAALRADRAGPRRLLLTELIVCMVIVAFSPLTDKHAAEPASAWMRRMTAILGLFFVLGLVSSGGRGPAKAAAGFGGLITVVLLVSERSIFVKLAQVMNSNSGDVRGTGPASDPDAPAGKTLKKAEKR